MKHDPHPQPELEETFNVDGDYVELCKRLVDETGSAF